MSKVSYTENFNLTQYSEVDEPVFLNDITRDNALIDSALQNSKETAENAVSIANTAKDTADYAKSVADGVASDLQVTNQNVANLDARVTQNEADIALLQPAKITALENKIDANTGLINALSNELDSVEAEVDAHGNRLDALESATGQLRTDVDTLRSDFDECCAEVRTHLDTLDTEQGVQNGRLDSLETRMGSAETRLDNLETEDETITGQVTVLTDRVNQLLSDLDPTNIQSALALTQQVIQNKNDIATLVGEVTALGEQAGNETLITTAQTLSGAINELAGASVSIDTALDTTSEHAVQNKVIAVAVNALQSALSDLQTALNTVDTREAGHYTNLSNGISGLNSRVGALESAVGNSSAGLVKDVSDLQTSLTTAQTDIDALEVTVGDANSGLVKGVADNADAIAGLETVVGDSSAGLVKDVADNADDISALQTTVGDSSSGLVKDIDDLTVDVSALETAVGDANSGLTKRVGDVESDVGTLETTVGDSTGGLVKDVDDLQTTVGDSSAGLVKDVADIDDRVDALEALNTFVSTEKKVGTYLGLDLFRRTITGTMPNTDNADAIVYPMFGNVNTVACPERYISTADWANEVYMVKVEGACRHSTTAMGTVPIPTIFQQTQQIAVWCNTGSKILHLRTTGYQNCKYAFDIYYTKSNPYTW